LLYGLIEVSTRTPHTVTIGKESGANHGAGDHGWQSPSGEEPSDANVNGSFYEMDDAQEAYLFADEHEIAVTGDKGK